jgi:hypothetical protein
MQHPEEEKKHEIVGIVGEGLNGIIYKAEIIEDSLFGK